MKSCPQCGKPLEDHDTQCPYCLAQVSPPPLDQGDPGTRPASHRLGKLSLIIIGLTIALGVLGLVPWFTDLPQPLTNALWYGWFATPVLLCLGLLLAAAAKITAAIKKNDQRGPRLASWTINLGCLVLIAGVLVALVIPRFVVIRHRKENAAKRVEAKQSLEQIASAQEKFREAHGRYAATFDDLKWTPPEGHLYGYFLAGQAIPAPSDPTPAPLPDPVVLDSSTTAFTAAATANLNEDAYYDVWTVDQSGKLQHVFDDR